jgi:hypothetical protein
MNQSLNIFRKDARQLLPQIMMPVFTLILFTVLGAKTWISGPPLLISTSALTHVLVLLFCMSWVVLITSLIQAERLVGLNQFWTTRPYEWSKLLAAKFFFLLAFFYVPLAISQMVLIHQAHLSIVQSVPAFLHNMLLLTAVFILPVVCTAALTRSIAQALLSLLVLFGAMVAVASLSVLFKGMPPRSLLPVQICIVAVVLLVVIVNQYRSRAARRSLSIFLFAPVLPLLLQAAVPGSSLAAFEYPLAADHAPVSVRFDSNPLRANAISSNPFRNSADAWRAFASKSLGGADAEIYLHLPLLVSEIETGNSFVLGGHRLNLAGANGYTWHSPWFSESGMLAPAQFSGEFTASSDVFIPRGVYDRLANVPVTVSLDFALTQLQDQAPTRSTLSTEGEMISGLGFCALDESYSVINCRSSFLDPPVFAIQTFRKVGPCTDPHVQVDPANGMVGSSEPASALPDITSVVVTPVALNSPRKEGFLCPGLPISFVEKRYQRRFQIRMPAATIHLSDYMGIIKLK